MITNLEIKQTVNCPPPPNIHWLLVKNPLESFSKALSHLNKDYMSLLPLPLTVVMWLSSCNFQLMAFWDIWVCSLSLIPTSCGLECGHNARLIQADMSNTFGSSKTRGEEETQFLDDAGPLLSSRLWYEREIDINLDWVTVLYYSSLVNTQIRECWQSLFLQKTIFSHVFFLPCGQS